MVKEGNKVKNFNLLDFLGNEHSLSKYLGKKVVIYIYPKDNTPGCTAQACNFRDNYEYFKENDIVLLGISADSQKSHEKFINKYKLPFTLLSDEDYSVIKYFGAWGVRNVYGRQIKGIIRSTYLIDEKGYLEKVWHPANAYKNTLEVIEYLNK
ncbi:MAG: thioredoxin-dependent thiol peroxidase [Acholeplasmataceae bacterium]|jgi:peroxiredoxin Q/BCP|nr:thioredoxin-dependent thiol peroxidase [Acholeplasmataceae bacterium]